MSKRRILVTGGAGFIGTNLVKYLVDREEFEIVILDNCSAGFAGEHLPPSVEFIRGDFTDRDTLARCVKGANSIVHLAALSGVGESVAEPERSFHVNVVGSFQLLEAARHGDVGNIIVASTGGALLGNASTPVSEASVLAPLSPYGASKMAVEGYCSAFSASYGAVCSVLRFSNVYGPISNHKNSVVANFIRRILAGEKLIVYGDGTQQRDYLYVFDLVQAIETVLRRRIAGTFQLGSGHSTPLFELIAALRGISGRRFDVEFHPARHWEVHSTRCDTSKAARTFGFDARTSLHEGLRRTWKWYSENVVIG